MLSLFSGVAGTAMSVIMRMELAAPGAQFLHGNNQIFNVLTLGHAVLMVFFLVMPGMMGGFGNYMLPLLIGALDVSFPRINAIGF
jgi:cytochrome c oxidase subunit 1